MRQILLLSLFIVFTILVMGASGCQQVSQETNIPVQNDSQISIFPSTGEVIIKDFAFNPSGITIAKGGKITFINQDSARHTVTSDNAPISFNLEIRPGNGVMQSFDIAGTYNYYCSIHPSMKGKIIVQ